MVNKFALNCLFLTLISWFACVSNQPKPKVAAQLSQNLSISPLHGRLCQITLSYQANDSISDTLYPFTGKFYQEGNKFYIRNRHTPSFRLFWDWDIKPDSLLHIPYSFYIDPTLKHKAISEGYYECRLEEKRFVRDLQDTLYKFRFCNAVPILSHDVSRPHDVVFLAGKYCGFCSIYICLPNKDRRFRCDSPIYMMGDSCLIESFLANKAIQ